MSNNVLSVIGLKKKEKNKDLSSQKVSENKKINKDEENYKTVFGINHFG